MNTSTPNGINNNKNSTTMTVAEMRFLEMVPTQLKEIVPQLKTLNENMAALATLVKNKKSEELDSDD